MKKRDLTFLCLGTGIPILILGSSSLALAFLNIFNLTIGLSIAIGGSFAWLFLIGTIVFAASKVLEGQKLNEGLKVGKDQKITRKQSDNSLQEERVSPLINQISALINKAKKDSEIFSSDSIIEHIYAKIEEVSKEIFNSNNFAVKGDIKVGELDLFLSKYQDNFKKQLIEKVCESEIFYIEETLGFNLLESDKKEFKKNLQLEFSGVQVNQGVGI